MDYKFKKNDIIYDKEFFLKYKKFKYYKILTIDAHNREYRMSHWFPERNRIGRVYITVDFNLVHDLYDNFDENSALAHLFKK